MKTTPTLHLCIVRPLTRLLLHQVIHCHFQLVDSPRTRHQQAAQAPAVPTDYTFQRVMSIGKKQSLTDDDEAFILRAMEFDFPIRYVHRNPKERHSKSRDRYELYTRSTTIRDAMRKGSLMADVWHDFERGFFTVTPGDPAALQR